MPKMAQEYLKWPNSAKNGPKVPKRAKKCLNEQKKNSQISEFIKILGQQTFIDTMNIINNFLKK